MDSDEGTSWPVRIVTGGSSSFAPKWIALRTGADEQGVLQHLFVGALELPDEWVSAARRDGQVAAAIGPCTDHWDGRPLPAPGQARVGTATRPDGQATDIHQPR
ncbi:MAG: hypothetical protein ACRDNF_06440, partial [Streptosporangiaceae bacterium]